jgi:hypothetical protein
MKKLICIIIVFSICFHQRLTAQELKSEFLFHMQAGLNTPQVAGSVLFYGDSIVFLNYKFQ